ncbi:MAG: peptide-N-glycosidase F-related protein [Bacteroidota bacterium]
MKPIYTSVFVFIFLILNLSGMAANGDTSSVRVWDKMEMNHYGNFDRWALFPSATVSKQNIKLKFTIGCTANGQCEWDYTVKIFARQHTGINDSTLKQAPSFTVNGTTKDSIRFSTVPTYTNVFNGTTKQTDSVETTKINIIRYSDISHPTTVVDTLKVWPVDFYRYAFDSTGKKTDSVKVDPMQTLYVTYTPYYSVFEVVNNFEVGRFISPYAKSFPKNFAYEYVYDVTDYASLLKDSTELRIEYQGYSYGFTATVDVLFTEGTPIREAYKVLNVYNGGFNYGGNPSIEAALTAKQIAVDLSAKSVKVRVLITGHGGESSENCAEFCPKHYYLKLNGTPFAEQLVWKDDCGSNAIAAQPGTWVYNRSNWCPGEKIRAYDYEMAGMIAGNTYSLDMDMEAFTASGGASYNLATQVFFYKAFTYQNDAAIEDIMAPTKNFWHSRYNPICDNAVIKLTNKGGAPLTTAVIKYQVSNGSIQSYNWTGNLGTDQSQDVTMPWILWNGDLSIKTFKVWIENTNGVADENAWNNTMTSDIDIPVVLPLSFLVVTKTNSIPSENSYTIKNEQGVVMYSKTFSKANTIITDTITLGYGCYTFNFKDEGGNGLSWWAATSQGNGSVQLKNYGGSTGVLKSFSSDFGNFQNLNFRTGTPVGVAETIENLSNTVKIYPQPATNVIHLTSEKITLTHASLLNMDGRLIKVFSVTDLENGTLNTSDIQTGFYLLSLTGANGEMLVKKVILSN